MNHSFIVNFSARSIIFSSFHYTFFQTNSLKWRSVKYLILKWKSHI
jgi:hypothetical protein